MDLAVAYWQAPPIARTAAAATFCLSVGIYLGIIPAMPFIWSTRALWSIPPSIWRVVTCFLITGPKLGMLFDTYFLYQYMSQLETSHARMPKKEDFVWYLIFICGTILTIDTLLGWGDVVFLKALALAMCYTTTRDQRGMTTTLYIVSIPALMTPWALLLAEALLGGGPGSACVMLEGLVAAHLFEFLTRIYPEFGGGPALLQTPAFLEKFVQAAAAMSTRVGLAQARAQPSVGVATGADPGPLPDSWKSRGRGQRLG